MGTHAFVGLSCMSPEGQLIHHLGEMEACHALIAVDASSTSSPAEHSGPSCKTFKVKKFSAYP